MMRAAVIREGAVAVEDRPAPVPGHGQLLVRVAAAGINGADLLQRRGGYPAPRGVPQDMPGLELAGEVVETGEGVSRFAIGDRVMAVVGGAGQAELAVVHEMEAMRVPDAVDIVAAGGFPETFTTAHDALFTQCGLRPGERALVNGASGGVGTAGVQLAAAAGARVSATTRHAEHRRALEEMGARVLGPDGAAESGPYDVILELVGAPNMTGNLGALGTGGRVSVIGVGAGARFEVDLLAVMGKRARILGSTLRSRSLEEKALAAREVERHVLPLLESGSVRVHVHETFSLEDAKAAYDRFAAGGKLGKIILTT